VRNGAPASDGDTNEENDESTARDAPVNSKQIYEDSSSSNRNCMIMDAAQLVGPLSLS
jgi:hypothetical protein